MMYGAIGSGVKGYEMTKLRIGLIGCGEVTQILHLPSLHQLADLFTVTALCDVSSQVLQAVGDPGMCPNGS